MINWQQVILNMRRHRPVSAIARQCGSNETHLNRIARGEVNEPRFNTGLKLLDVHLDLCPEKHNEGIFL